MQSKRLGWILLAPTLVILFFFGVLPFIYVVYVSFHSWNPFAVNPEMVFNGADNFRKIVFDAAFLNSVGRDGDVRPSFAVLSELILGYLSGASLHAGLSRQGDFPHDPYTAPDHGPDHCGLCLETDDHAVDRDYTALLWTNGLGFHDEHRHLGPLPHLPPLSSWTSGTGRRWSR